MCKLAAHFFEVGACWAPGAFVKGGNFVWQRFPALAAAIRHPNQGWILFDTGYDPIYFELCRDWTHRWLLWGLPAYLPKRSYLKTQLTAAGISANEIRTIIISHFHLDHFAGVHRFPNAELVSNRSSWEHVQTATGIEAARKIFHPGAIDRWRIERGILLRSDSSKSWEGFQKSWDLFGDGTIRIIELPGHTPGQIGIFFRAAERQFLLVADAVWRWENLQGAMPLSPARLIIEDYSAFCATISQLRQFAAQNPKICIVPSHCAVSLATAQKIAASAHPPQSK